MKPDGGPAFPQTMVIGPNGQITSGWDGYGMGGMTLRDYFAAKAMHAELATAGAFVAPAEALAEAAERAGNTIEAQIAINAYALADAMLAERVKP